MCVTDRTDIRGGSRFDKYKSVALKSPAGKNYVAKAARRVRCEIELLCLIVNTFCAETVRSRRRLSIHWWLSDKTIGLFAAAASFSKTNREKREFSRALHPSCHMVAVNKINQNFHCCCREGCALREGPRVLPFGRSLDSGMQPYQHCPAPFMDIKHLRLVVTVPTRRTFHDSLPHWFVLRVDSITAVSDPRREKIAQRGVPPLTSLLAGSHTSASV